MVELEASSPVAELQDTGTDRNRVLCKPSGASRLTIKGEQKSGHFRECSVVAGKLVEFVFDSVAQDLLYGRAAFGGGLEVVLQPDGQARGRA